MIELKHKYTRRILYISNKETDREAVVEAIAQKADLSSADLSYANLSSADLSCANLSYADLSDAGQDCRGYRFFGQYNNDKKVFIITAGCRKFSVGEARAHWEASHEDDVLLRAECLAKVAYLETIARSRGWLAEEPEGEK